MNVFRNLLGILALLFFCTACLFGQRDEEASAESDDSSSVSDDSSSEGEDDEESDEESEPELSYSISVDSPSEDSLVESSVTLTGTCENLDGLSVTLTGDFDESPATIECADDAFSENVTLSGSYGEKSFTISHANLDEDVTFDLDYSACAGSYANQTTHPSMSLPAGFAAGAGTSGDPYIICDIYQLQKMKDGLNAYYQLGNDIDASPTQAANSASSIFATNGFEPVGQCANDNCSDDFYGADVTNAFTGSFDGDGKSIDDLYINCVDDGGGSCHGAGVFGLVSDDAVLTNVSFDEPDINSDGAGGTGTLAGNVQYNVSTTNAINVNRIYVTGGSITNNNAMGTGSVIGVGHGQYYWGLYFSRMSSSSTVTNTNLYAGGIIGLMEQNEDDDVGNVLERFQFSGTVSAQYAGGIFGGSGSWEVREAHVSGTVDGQNIAGGISGRTEWHQGEVPFSDVSFSGTIGANDANYVGGLQGYGGPLEVKRAMVTDSAVLTTSSGGAIGSLSAATYTTYSGYNHKFINSFSAAKIYGGTDQNPDYNGGIMGRFDGTGDSPTFTNTFWLDRAGDDVASGSCFEGATATGCTMESFASLSGYYSAGASGHAVYDHGNADAWSFGDGQPWLELDGTGLPVPNPFRE